MFDTWRCPSANEKCKCAIAKSVYQISCFLFDSMVGHFFQVRNTSLVYFRRPDDSNTVNLNVFNLLDTELKWKT